MLSEVQYGGLVKHSSDIDSHALRLLLSTVLDAAVAIDAAGDVVGWNDAAVQIFGWPRNEALGRNLNDLIVPTEHQRAHALGMHRYQRTGEAHVVNRRIEIAAHDKSGRQFPIELSITEAPEESGAAFVGFMRDISERRDAETALREAREIAERLASEREAILSQLAEGVIIADTEGKLTFVNEAASELHGMRQLGVAPSDYSDIYRLLREDGSPYPPYDLPLARAVGGETVSKARWRIRRPDGSEALAVGTARPLFGENGAQVAAVLTVRDETERDRAERALRENEARLRALTDNLPGGVVYQIWTNADASERKFLFISQSFERMTGFSVEATLNDPLYAYQSIHPDDQAKFAEAEGAAIRDKVPLDIQARFRKADGTSIWCHFISAPREQEDGSLIWDGLQIDITRRVETENALRELNQALEERVSAEVAERERVWSVTRDLVVVSGSDGRYRKVNPAWHTELGYDPSSLIGTAFDALVHPDDLEIAQEGMARLKDGQPISDIDIRVRASDATYRWYSWTCVAEADGFYAAGRDITARRELQEHLRQAQKMEAVGQLTGGIAHDFNNLLTIIQSAVDMIRRPNLPEDRQRRYVDAIAETVERASRLTGQLLAFARRQPLKPELIELAVQMPVIVDLVRPLLGARIAVKVDRIPQRLFAKIDVSQFETALINLMINARDAMAEEGQINIRVGEADAIPALWGKPARSGEFIALTVSDTGSGIASDAVERIFEPFFTTKEVGRGTGLGLSQVYGFVQQSGGDVDIKSLVGEGSDFTIYIPKATPPSSPKDSGEAAYNQDKSERSLRVLVVEDDERVGQFCAETLDDLGHHSKLVNSAEAALEEIQANDRGYDVVFSDVIMAGGNGLELAQTIRVRYPRLPVVLTSGYSEIIAKDGADGFNLLRKPYSVKGLSRALRNAVEAWSHG